MRIVFMGTPDFAVPSLRRLCDDGFDVAGVFTQPDRPRDRGMKPRPSPVKELAESRNIPVWQPETLKDGGAERVLRELGAELLVVVAYGKILPASLIDAPKYGTINLHGSLLPRYRGSAPIQWAVLNGDEKTGVTTMYVRPALDSGDIIYAEETAIGEYETSGELFDRLSLIGAELLSRTVRDIELGVAPRVPQDESGVTVARRLTREDSPVDWTGTPREVIKHIYGMQPWPAATAELGGVGLRIWGARYTANTTAKPCGSVVRADADGIEIACAGGTVLVTEVQAPGKKRMSAGDYLRGHPLAAS